MSVKTAQTGKVTANSHALTVREQEVLDLLLTGSVPKEIASSLNISYDTVLSHKKNLYRKLDVKSIQELFAKYSSQYNSAGNTDAINKIAQTEEVTVSFNVLLKSPKILILVGLGITAFLILFFLVFSLWKNTFVNDKNAAKAIFIKWETFQDNFGSSINIASNIENIQDNYFETFTISGNNSEAFNSYAGVTAYPDPSTLDTMRKMKRFSFMVLGDGGTYGVNLQTTETSEEADFNHYRKDFTTKKGVIYEVNFNINELRQSPHFGKQVPFVRDHIETFNLQVYSKGDFNLKFWNIRFY